MVILLVLFFLLVVWLLRNEAKARFLSLSVMKCAAAHFVTIELLEHQEAGFGPRSGPLYMDRGKAVGRRSLKHYRRIPDSCVRDEESAPFPQRKTF
jgi:hypothetical protein